MPTLVGRGGPIPRDHVAHASWTVQQRAVHELAVLRYADRRRAARQHERRLAAQAEAALTQRVAAAILATLPREDPEVVAARRAELCRPLPPAVAAAISRGGAR